MSTFSVVPTVEMMGDGPPRVRLDVSPAAAIVTRLTADGVTRPVRTLACNPSSLLYDYETPYGSPVAYSTVESPEAISAEVEIHPPTTWTLREVS